MEGALSGLPGGAAVSAGGWCGGRRALDHTHVAGIVYRPCTVVLININRVAREVATEKVGQCESVCDAC